MKSSIPIRPWISTAVLGGLILSLSVFAFRAKADAWDKKTVLTVDRPIQVEDTYLEPGSYVFKLLNSDSQRHVVEILNRDENHVINTIVAIPNYRLQPTGNSRFAFYETPPGSASALRAWFYPGDNFGQEFRYPKQLRQIATVMPTTPTRTAEPTPPILTKPSEPETPPTPQPQVANVPEAASLPPAREEPALIAQNNTPGPPPAPVQTPTELPRTATPFPLIGLGGLASLLGYSLLRSRI